MPKKTDSRKKRQALDAKRTTSDYVLYPEDLYVEKNVSHLLYDPRGELPVTRARLRSTLDAMPPGPTKQLLRWVLGEIGDDEARDSVAALATALEQKASAQSAA